MPPPTSMRRESPQPSGAGAAPPLEDPNNTSDNESGGEKPVREKLRDTSIATQAMEEDATASGSDGSQLRRKRSHEDIQYDEEDNDEEAGKPGKQPRKRSRSNTPEDKMESVEKASPQLITNGSRDRRSPTPDLSSSRVDDAQQAGLASPKNKRTRDQVLRDEEYASSASGDATLTSESADKDNKLPGDDRQTKRHRESGSPEPATAQGVSKIPLSSGFANSSVTSPFGALASKSPPAKSDSSQTSESKFASSGFGKLANASASPFGVTTINKGPSPFGAPAGKSVFASSGTSAFGAPKDATAPMQPSAFGSGGSAFGSGSSTSIFGSAVKSGSVFGSGFAAASKPGSLLGSFAGGSGPKIEGLSSKPAKAFGAAEDSDQEADDDDDGEDDEGHKSPKPVPDQEVVVKKDKRFFEQDVETGEEGETTAFSSRAKLYNFVKKEGQWKERGVGTLKVNVLDVDVGEDDDDEEDEEKGNGKGKAKETKPKADKKRARFIMRADGSQRVVLNSPVQKGSNFGAPGTDGERPKGTQLMFLGILDGGELQTLQLKLRAENAQALWDVVQQLQEDI